MLQAESKGVWTKSVSKWDYTKVFPTGFLTRSPHKTTIRTQLQSEVNTKQPNKARNSGALIGKMFFFLVFSAEFQLRKKCIHIPLSRIITIRIRNKFFVPPNWTKRSLAKTISSNQKKIDVFLVTLVFYTKRRQGRSVRFYVAPNLFKADH